MTTTALMKTPLNAWHRAHGARMVEFCGWEMPIQYESGILQEHLATRKFGGLFDVSHMGRFWIRGKDRIAFLQHVLSNNAVALEPWQAQYTLIPNANGGVIDDAYLYRFGDDEYLLVVNAANREKDLTHLRAVATRFDVTIEDHTEALAMIAFQGPVTGRILDRIVGCGILPEPMHNRLSEIGLCGARVLIARTGYTGEPIGFELFVPAEKAEAIWCRLYEASKDKGVVPVGLGARDTLRLEAGMPLYGHEFGLEPEGLDGERKEIPALAVPLACMALSLSPLKGDYIGRQALAKQFEQVQLLRTGLYKPTPILPRRIKPLAVMDKGVARRGDLVFLGDKKVGVVTSGTVTPYWKFEGEGATIRITDQTDRRAIALAYLDATLLPEQEVDVLVRGRRLGARIVRWHGRSDAAPYFRPIVAVRQEPIRIAPSKLSVAAKVDLLLRKSLENHEWRQRRCINLIPSEMTPSPLVRMLQVSDPVGRYAEHKEVVAAFDQEVYYYQGTDFIAWVEARVAEEMAEFLGCSLIEARTISGQMANTTVFSAFVDYKNRIDRRREPERARLVLNHHIGKGGHLSAQPMGALRDYIARDPVTEQYAVVNFPVCRDNPYKIDCEELGRMLERIDPEIIIFGKSMVLHREPVAEVRKMVQHKKIPPIIMYDMAHVLGLVGPHFQEPFKEGADVVTGSTHKTFFGTQRGIIGASFQKNTPQYDLWKAIQRRAFPGMVSNHHLGTLLGLLLAAMEMNAFKDEYQPQVIANAKAFARALKRAGLTVEGDPSIDFTETHQVIVNVGYARGPEVARHLEKNNIIVNYQAIPTDEGFTASSALRMGVSEMTRFGMKEKDFEAFAELFAEAVSGKQVAEQVAKFRANFQTIQYCFDHTIAKPFRDKFLETF